MSVPSIASLLEVPPVSSGVLPQQLRLPEQAIPQEPARLEIRVVWGDLTRVSADIHIAGHIQGVLPASAENALDNSISIPRPSTGGNTRRGLIAEHTRRRWLVGELGEISYFPGSAAAGSVSRAAVAGMGRLGTFTESRADQLFASLLREIGSLSDVGVAAMNLIGSGAGNLTIEQATRALYRGFREVLSSWRNEFSLHEMVIVEIDRLRAEQIASMLKDLTRESPNLVVPAWVEHGEGGLVDPESAAVFTVRAIANMLRRLNDVEDAPEDNDRDSADSGAASDRTRALLAELNDQLPTGLGDQVPRQLETLANLDLTSVSVVIGQPISNRTTVPTRISISLEGNRMRWAALTERSTVPERQVLVNTKLVSELVRRLTAPNEGDAARLPRMLREWIVPDDLEHYIDETSPLVLEVDGAAAQLPWEFLTDRLYDLNERAFPLALRTPIARQLRTSYARTVADYGESSRLRALIIADPGPPLKRLPEAQKEGVELAQLFRERGVEVRLFVGPPGSNPPPSAQVAGELDVLTELLIGRYDIVHFAGHGTMPNPGDLDSERPWQAGWLFADDVLTARELTQMAWAPRIVTANACWTAATIGAAAARPAGEVDTEQPDGAVQQARLTAVLADEFLRVGVAHYIGTSWRIPDEMARRFVISFYDAVLPKPGQSGMPFGEALRHSREVLFGLRGASPSVVQPEQWSGWAAYQHYGDPTDLLDAFDDAVQPKPEPAEASVPPPTRRRRSPSRRRGAAST